MADHSNLPAPYESPWRQLGRALLSVTASLRLDLRYLWRQNRSGGLPRPPWWPRDLASLFWPLVLGAATALLLALISVLHVHAAPGRSAINTTATEAPQAPDPAAAAPTPFAATALSESASSKQGPAATAFAATARPATSATSASEAPEQDVASAPVGGPVPPIPQDRAASDPLLASMGQGDQPNWVVAVQTQAARGRLVLEVEPAFNRLSFEQRRRQGAIWLERSQSAGFDHLELRSSTGQLLGYQARVGSGMILLTPEPNP